jgi:hypothetical protein
MSARVVVSDIERFCRIYKGEKFHAVLCDPPYHLTSITERFGKKGSAPAKFGTDGVFARASRGFMGEVWDGGDVAFRPETWHAIGEHMYAGAFGMAFASSRGWHRMAVAIEDAGFIIHPTIFVWATSMGFPKATNISKNISRRGAGNNLASIWSSHRYGAQALKPAAEPIIVFQRPYSGKPIDCIIETGAGAINIDKARIGTDLDSGEATGRWPANFAIQHHPNCKIVGRKEGDSYVINRFTDGAKPFGNGAGHDYEGSNIESGYLDIWDCVDGCPAKSLNVQSGYSQTKRIEKPSMCREEANTWGGTFQRNRGARGHSDSGGASRFFYNAGWNYEVEEGLDKCDSVFYVSKAGRKEREAGLENKQSETSQGSWSSNNHPTVKPISLAVHLATLLLPPDAYSPRKILVPFSGSGSEMIGAIFAGWETVVGVEMSGDYADIARARISHWEEIIEERNTAEQAQLRVEFEEAE